MNDLENDPITDGSKLDGAQEVLAEIVAEDDHTLQAIEDTKAAAAAVVAGPEHRRLTKMYAVLEEVYLLDVRADAKRHHEKKQRAKFAKALADPNATSSLTTATAGSFRGMQVQPDMVEGIVGARGTLNMGSGYRGSMKSFSALSLAGVVGCGLPTLWGLKVNAHGPVLVVYRESPANLPKRIGAWEAHYGRQMENVHFYTGPVDMKDPLDVQQIALLVKDLGAILVIFDPVARTGGGKEDAEDFGAYRLGLESLRDVTGASIYVNHNTGHGDKARGRGHSTLEDAMDSCVAFVKPERGAGIVLSDTKSRDSAPLKDIRLKFEPAGDQGSGTPVLMHATEAKTALMKALQDEIAPLLAAIDATPGGLTAEQVARVIGKQKNNLGRELKPYLDAHVIEREGKTTSLRYVRGDDPDGAYFTIDQELPNSTQKGLEDS